MVPLCLVYYYRLPWQLQIVLNVQLLMTELGTPGRSNSDPHTALELQVTALTNYRGKAVGPGL